jgi:Flp pilus assembly protein TadD
VPVDVDEIARALDAGRLTQAKTLFERAKLARQQDPRIDLLLAEYWLATGDTDQALAQFTRSATVASLRPEALQGAGIAALRLGRTDAALRDLQQAVAAKPGLKRAWNALGAAADQGRLWSLAEKAYGEALKLSPKDPEVLSNRGYSRTMQGRGAEAVADLTDAVASRPGDERIRNNLRIALAMSGRYDEAFAGADRRQLYRELNNIGYAALMRGDYAAAEAYLNRSIEQSDVFYRTAWKNLTYLRDVKATER